VDGDYPSDVLPVMLLLGVGAGLSLPSLTTIAMSGAAPGDASLASGLINPTRQVGAALGVAVLASLSATPTESLLGSGGPTASALTGGYHLAFAVAAGFLVAAIFLAVNLLPRRECSPATTGAPRLGLPNRFQIERLFATWVCYASRKRGRLRGGERRRGPRAV
jgi:hypothetical protein